MEDIYKKLIGDALPKIEDFQLITLDNIYGLDEWGIDVEYIPNYRKKDEHPECNHFMGLTANVEEWKFEGLKGLEIFLRESIGLMGWDVLGQEKNDSFTRRQYYFEKNGVCGVFINEAIPF